MKKLAHRRIEDRNRFRPRLELLESRVQPSAGTLDPTFGAGGIALTSFGAFDLAYAVAMQSDDKIVVAGKTGSLDGSDNNFALARYGPNGKLDKTFNFDGNVATDFSGSDIAVAVAIQSDGKIVAGGGDGDHFALARYNPDGTLDLTFGGDGKVVTDFGHHGEFINGLAIANGKIVVVGSSDGDFALARYNDDGTLDNSFGIGGEVTTDFGNTEHATALAIQTDGKIVVVGTSFSNTTEGVAIARYHPDGTLDGTFGVQGRIVTNLPGGASEANAVAVQSNGRIVVAGTYGNDFLLVRYQSDGTLDSHFDGDGIVTTNFGGSETANGVAVQADGRIIAVGSYSNPLDLARGATLARYLPDGSLDGSFGKAGKVVTQFGGKRAAFNAVTLQADGKIVAVGDDNSQNFAVARFDPFNTIRISRVGSLLTILGTPGADHYNVSDNSAGNITVASRQEGAAPFTVPGVQHIIIGTRDGDDVVNYQLAGATSTSALLRPADLDVDLGRGNDSLRVLIAPTRLLRDVTINVDLGAGDDSFTLLYPADPSTPPPDPDCTPSLNVTAQGGAGHDVFQTIIGRIDQPSSAAIPRLGFGLDLAYDGGQGDDTLLTRFLNVDMQLPAVQRINGGEGNDTIENTWAGDVIDAPLIATQNGGEGNDTLTTTVSKSALNAAVTLNTWGGNGNDSLNAQFNTAEINARLALTQNGGLGNDDIRVIFGFNPQPDPPAMPGVIVTAPVNVMVDGGPGADSIAAICGFNPQPDPPAFQLKSTFQVGVLGGAGDDSLTAILLPAVQRGSSFMASFDGGAGQDTLTGILLPAVQHGGAIDVAFLGGNGNDSIDVQVDLTGFTPESGRLRVAVDGGDGSDHMVFLTHGLDRTMENAVFTLDGGVGKDFAIVTSMVHVTDCEHVEIV